MTDKQLKMQEAIMIAIHGSIEEANRNEGICFGCCIKAKKDGDIFRITETVAGGCTVIIGYGNNYSDHSGVEYLGERGGREIDDFDIIGLPPTLSRVLTALGDGYCYSWGQIHSVYSNDEDYGFKDNICDWKLLNEDGSDSNLFDQTEETQDVIYNLLIS